MLVHREQRRLEGLGIFDHALAATTDSPGGFHAHMSAAKQLPARAARILQCEYGMAAQHDMLHGPGELRRPARGCHGCLVAKRMRDALRSHEGARHDAAEEVMFARNAEHINGLAAGQRAARNEVERFGIARARIILTGKLEALQRRETRGDLLARRRFVTTYGRRRSGAYDTT